MLNNWERFSFVVHRGGIANQQARKYLCRMYFKISMRTNPSNGKWEGYYRLVESYRNNDDLVCYRTLLNIGFLDDEVTVEQLNRIRRRLVDRAENLHNRLFSPSETEDLVVNRFVNDLWNRLIQEKRIDTGEKQAKKRGKNGETLEAVFILRYRLWLNDL